MEQDGSGDTTMPPSPGEGTPFDLAFDGDLPDSLTPKHPLEYTDRAFILTYLATLAHPSAGADQIIQRILDDIATIHSGEDDESYEPSWPEHLHDVMEHYQNVAPMRQTLPPGLERAMMVCADQPRKMEALAAVATMHTITYDATVAEQTHLNLVVQKIINSNDLPRKGHLRALS